MQYYPLGFLEPRRLSVEKLISLWSKFVDANETNRFIYKQREDMIWMRGVVPPRDYSDNIHVFSLSMEDTAAFETLVQIVLSKYLVKIMDGVRDRQELGWRLIIFDIPDKSKKCFLLSHHLLMDGMSLVQMFRQLFTEIIVPPKVTYAEWTKALRLYSKDMVRPPSYWMSYSANDVLSIPGDRKDMRGAIGRWRAAYFSTKARNWDAIIAYARDHLSCGALSILALGALRLWRKRNNKDRVQGLLEFVLNGRKGPPTTKDLDVSSNYGFYSTPTLEEFTSTEGERAKDALLAVQKTLREVPNGGCDYRLCPSEYRKHLDGCGTIRLNYFPPIPGQSKEGDVDTGPSQTKSRCLDFPSPTPLNRLGFYVHTSGSLLICQCLYNENFWTEEGMNLLIREFWQIIDALGEELQREAKL